MPYDRADRWVPNINEKIIPIGNNDLDAKELHTYESALRALNIMTEEGLPQEEIMKTMDKVGKNIKLTGEELLAKIKPKEAESNETNQIN